MLGIAYNKMRAQDGAGYYYYNYQYSSHALTGERHGPPPVARLAPRARRDRK